MPSGIVSGALGVNVGLSSLERLNSKLLKWAMNHDGITSYSLGIDATGIEAEKQSAKMIIRVLIKGFMPMPLDRLESPLMHGLNLVRIQHQYDSAYR